MKTYAIYHRSSMPAGVLADPDGAVFVAVGGSDGGAGTAADPFATAARALSDFERLPVPDDNGFFPASPQSRGSPMSRGSRRFPSPGQSLQARQFFPPAATLG